MDHIDVANKKTVAEFIKAYLPCSEHWNSWTHPKTKENYKITLSTAKDLSDREFEACFQLVYTTSYEDYKESKNGWKPRSKKKEMRLLDLKYFLVKRERDEEIQGFVSLMPTYEDDYPVLYCYEIHLSSELQRTGLGTALMNRLEAIGLNIPETAKTMLTCFVSNTQGVKFYEKLGYTKDEYSPPPRILRNGNEIEVDYLILSKPIPR